MAKNSYGVAAYQTAQLTMPPLQAVVMLYDGIIRHMKFFLAAAEEGDAVRQLEEAKKAMRILEGLNRALDMKEGGPVALRLRDTYSSISVTLYRCVGQKDAVEACKKLIEAMSVLRDAWAEIAEIPLLDASRAGPPKPIGAPEKAGEQPDAGAS